MRSRTTIALFLLAAVALGFIVVFERRAPTTVEAAERTRLLLDLPTAEITKVEITNAAGRVMMERNGAGRWQLTAPVRDRADLAAAAQLLQLASATEVIERLIGDEATKKSRLKELGLDAGQSARVVFYGQGHDPGSVLIGKPAAYEGSVYVQVQQGEKGPAEVAVVRAPWAAALLARSPGEWRDPRLVAAAPDAIYRMAVRGSEGEVEIERDRLTVEDRKRKLAPLWRLTKPLAERADQELISDRLLPGLLNARAQAFADAPGAAAPASAATRVTVWSEGGPDEGEALEIFGSQDPSEAWVRVEGRPGFARSSADLLALRLCTIDRLRDTKLASLDFRRLTTVTLKDAAAGETPLFLFKQHWSVVHDGLVYEAHRDRVQALVEALNATLALKAIDQPAAPAEYGLDAPFLEIVFGTAPHSDRSRPTPPAPSNSETLRLGERRNRFFAQWAGKPTVYQFDGFILGEIPREWIHYKSPRLLSFAPLSLRQLVVTQDPSPPVELTFDLAGGAKWSASRQGADVTEFLDRPHLERLLNRLSELNASDWSADSAAGLDAVKSPSLRLDVTLEQFDDESGAPKPMTVALRLAPTVPGQRTALYYGRLNDEPNVFVIRRDLYDELAAPLIIPKPEAAKQ